MFELNDTFNNRVISRHKTLEAAIRAGERHNRAVKKANGQSSYIPTLITLDGERLSDDMHEEAMRITDAVYYGR